MRSFCLNSGPDSRSVESFHLVGKSANRGCGHP